MCLMSGPENTTTLTEKSFQQSPATHMPHPHAHDPDIKTQQISKKLSFIISLFKWLRRSLWEPWCICVRCPHCNHWSDVLEAESRWLLVMVVWRQESEREREREGGDRGSWWLRLPGPLPLASLPGLAMSPGTGMARTRPLLRYSDPSNFVISSPE